MCTETSGVPRMTDCTEHTDNMNRPLRHNLKLDIDHTCCAYLQMKTRVLSLSSVRNGKL